jgi:hypothetical protein
MAPGTASALATTEFIRLGGLAGASFPSYRSEMDRVGDSSSCFVVGGVLEGCFSQVACSASNVL